MKDCCRGISLWEARYREAHRGESIAGKHAKCCEHLADVRHLAGSN